ncbi:MAG: iron-containing alcohol dehydrogenase [Oscillibacter sp.]|jgi:alcohol dehydrogenase YqhD (iron-dependent ADH family)|nr:iron-containing alcohol dehydrogenase [Oscillibacter sp.]
MENFTFYSPTLFAFGDGQEKKTGALIRRFGGTRALLISGGGSVRKNGAYGDAAASLQAAGVPFAELDGVQPNPRSGKVREGIALARETGADFLLAVGGGSVIDTAKAVGLGILYDGDFWDFFRGAAPVERTVPVGVVLTIAASGSEGSDSAVITNEELGLKWGMPHSDLIRPRFAVLNPRYTCSLPPYQTACGAVDIIAHVLERYFTNTPDVALTDRLCEALVKTVLDAAPRAMENPGDLAARADLMWSGMLAHNNLCGTGRVQDWASHQIEHELSAFTDCAHGAGLAVVMPAWMEYVMTHDVPRFAQFAVRMLGCEMDFAAPERTAREGIARLRRFFASLGMPASLEELGFRADQIPAAAANRAKKPGGFPFGNFVKIGQPEAAAILRLALRRA